MSRKYSFNIQSSFQPHYNPAVGSYVTSRSDFNDRLKVISEEASIKTGIHHDFKPHDAQDHEAFGLTADHVADALDHQARIKMDGPPPPPLVIPLNADLH